MRSLAYIFVVFSFLGYAQGTKTVNPNPPYVPKKFNFDKVVAYKLKQGTFSIVLNEKLQTSSIKGSETVSRSEIDTLHKIMRGFSKTEESYKKEDRDARVGVVYYLKDSIVGYFNIASGEKITLYYRLISEPRHVPNNRLLMNKISRSQMDAWVKTLAIKDEK
jgi:hypothetical protein